MPDAAANNRPPVVHASRFQRADDALFLLLYNRTKNPVFDVVMPVLSHIGNLGFLWIAGSIFVLIFGIILLKLPLFESTLAMIITVGIGEIAAEAVIKNLFWRTRPYDALPGVSLRVPVRHYARTSSFPSGHTAAYIGSAVTLSIYYPSLAPLFILIAVSGSFSRVYVAAHYPSDVAAGSLIGILAALLNCVIYRPYIYKFIVIALKFTHLAPYVLH